MTPRLSWLLSAFLLGCAAQPKGDASDSSRPPNELALAATDTVRGKLHIVGSEPVTQLVLKPGDSSIVLTIHRSALLWRADGMDVCARVQPSDGKTYVRGYSVRGIDGHGAVDGIVRILGDSAVLERPGAPPLSLGSSRSNRDLVPEARAAVTSSATVVLGRPVLSPDSLSHSCDNAPR